MVLILSAVVSIFAFRFRSRASLEFKLIRPLSLLKISTGLREAGDFREPAVPLRSGGNSRERQRSKSAKIK
jgi:hypothetical protein